MARAANNVPSLPWEIIIKSFATHLVPLDDGGMMLVVTPGLGAADGQTAYMAPSIRVGFTADGWRQFKRSVEADGEIAPLHVARVLPAK